MELLRERWPGIVDTIAGSSRRLAAIYGEGTPHAVTADTLVLRFAFPFHASQAEDHDSAATVAGIIERAVGVRYRITGTVGEADDEDPPGHAAVDDEASAVINREAAEAAGDLVDPDVAHDAAISTLGKVLGATVITDSST